MVILILLQFALEINLDIHILEMIYGATIMPVFDVLWIVGNAHRIGFTHKMFDFLYEEYYYWTRLWYYVKKIRKYVMMSWNKIHFFNSEQAWEVSNKTRYRNLRTKR